MSRVGPTLVIAVAVVVAAFSPWEAEAKRKKSKEDDGGTIRSLERRKIEIRRDDPVEASQAKAIESYRAFLELVDDDPVLRAEAMRRLADLQLQAGEDGLAEEDLVALEQQAYAEAAHLYEEILESYPDHARNDGVLYQLSRAYENNADPEKALATLDRLVHDYPHTSHMGEAQFRRGEILFSSQTYHEAEEAYAAVLAIGETSEFYEQSLYKHGWALFKQMKHEEGLESFLILLDRKLIDPDEPDRIVSLENMGRAEREIIEDSFRVTSVSFSYLEGPKSVDQYLSRRGDPPYSYLVYSRLGQLYLEKERYTDAAKTYRVFVDSNPIHPRAPMLQAEAIEAYKQGGFASLVLEGKKEFVEVYGAESAFWQAHPREEHPEVLGLLKQNLRDLAEYYHAEAQSTKDPAHYREAVRWYRAQLAAFPDDGDAPETNFLLAEILFETERYREAAAEYETTAYAYAYHEHSSEAGYAALVAYKYEHDRLEGADQAAWYRQSIESSLRFARTYPEHAEAPGVLTTAAEDLFALNELDLAIEASKLVILFDPPVSPEMERTAWTVLGHSQFDLGSYGEAEKAYVRVQQLMPQDDPERDALVERLASSIYKQGEQAQAAGDLTAAIVHFQRVGVMAPDSSIRVSADYDAAAALVNMQDWNQAIPALESFRQLYPDHEFNSEVNRALAQGYEDTGQQALAAGELLRIANNPAEGYEAQQQALWSAAELYENSGQVHDAAVTYADYVQRYPAPLDPAIEARQRLANTAESSGDNNTYFYWLGEIVAADAQAGTSRTERSRYLAAKASLVLAEPHGDAFRGVRLVIPLDQSLQVKKQLMESALQAYGQAADYGIAEVTTAATYQIAEIYHVLSRDLFDSERPSGLTPDELEQYEILLEEQAFPFEEEAIGIHQTNTRRASEGIYDEWVQKSFEVLAGLLPARYAKAEIGEEFVTAIR